MSKSRSVSGQFSQLDRTNWQRRFDKMQVIIDKVNDISDQILQLEMSKIPHLDEIAGLREMLVAECVHPKDYLIETDGIVNCKFCDRRFSVN